MTTKHVTISRVQNGKRDEFVLRLVEVNGETIMEIGRTTNLVLALEMLEDTMREE